MNERIKIIRKHYNLSQIEFGSRINVKQTTVAAYERGTRTPLDAIVGAICREFNVREQWLRTGEGEMFNPVNRDEEIMAFMGSVLSADGDTAKFQKRFLTVLSRLTLEEWKLIQDKIKELQAED